MAHNRILQDLRAFSDEALRVRDPFLYLARLSPLHFDWHFRGLRRSQGFLLFHWHVIENLKRARVPEALGGIRPYSRAYFSRLGRSYDVTTRTRQGDITTLANFSADLEDWHNLVHGALEMETGLPLGDARQNVYFREFWRLHYFINARFLTELKRYDGNGSLASQIDRLEQLDHRIVAEI